MQWFFDQNPAGYAEPFRKAMIDVLGKIDSEGLETAAVTVLEDVQHELGRAEANLERPVAIRLSSARSNAIRALMHLRGEMAAKRVVLEIAPLTICTGDANRVRPTTRGIHTVETFLAGELRFSVPGCGRVFTENGVTSGNSMWTSACEGCRRHKRKRDAGRALKKRIETALRSPRVYVGHGNAENSVPLGR